MMVPAGMYFVKLLISIQQIVNSRGGDFPILSDRRHRRREVDATLLPLFTIEINFRRLLYVACTRAQGLLYLSHAAVRKVAGETKTKKLSEFVSVVTNQNPVGIWSTIPSAFRLISRRHYLLAAALISDGMIGWSFAKF